MYSHRARQLYENISSKRSVCAIANTVVRDKGILVIAFVLPLMLILSAVRCVHMCATAAGRPRNLLCGRFCVTNGS